MWNFKKDVFKKEVYVLWKKTDDGIKKAAACAQMY